MTSLKDAIRCAFSNAVEPVVLNVGCGPRNPDTCYPGFRKAEWKEIRLDIDPGVDPDVIASIVDMSAVPSASVGAVWTSHTLEHLHPYDVPLALAEFHRVLVSGGFALMRMPDLQRAAELIAEGRTLDPLYDTPVGPVTALDLIYGHHRLTRHNAYIEHHTGFTSQTLSFALLQAGFSQITVDRVNVDVFAIGYKR